MAVVCHLQLLTGNLDVAVERGVSPCCRIHPAAKTAGILIEFDKKSEVLAQLVVDRLVISTPGGNHLEQFLRTDLIISPI